MRRLCIALMWVMTGCSGDTGISIGETDATFQPATADVSSGVVNEAPSGSITSPSEGQVTQFGDVVSFGAVVNDDQTPRHLLRVTWLSNLSGVLLEEEPNEAGASTFETSALAAGAHIITLVVIDDEGMATEVTRGFVVNGPPGQPQIAIDPSEPKTGDDLHAQVLGDAVDPNRPGSELTYHYTWFKNDEAKQTTSTVLSNQTIKGELWRVEIRANDGTKDGLPASVEVMIGNTAPNCESAVLLPAAGPTTEEFTCSCGGRDEPDEGDPATDTCTFSNGAAWLADGCNLPADLTSKGMNISCTVTPSDGEDEGTPVTSSEVPVMNSSPSSPVVVLSPVEGTVSTLFTCDVVDDATDVDGDTVTYQYTWYVNGYANPGTGSPMVLASSLARDEAGTQAAGGDQVFCRVVADDTDGGLSNISDSQVITLLNSPPTGGAVLISPAAATEADILTCVPGEAEDPDDQEVLWSYQWYVTGDDDIKQPIEGATAEALTGLDFNRGDTVSCTATPTDGVSAGEPVESKNQVTIANSLPSLEGATLLPAQVDAYGEFTCSHFGWLDLDNDPVEVAFAWLTVDGDDLTLLPGKVESTLLAATLEPGAIVRCQVTPRNGDALGTPVQSGDGEVMNQAPTLETVTLTPEEPTVDSTLVCAPDGFWDLEGDGPFYSYAWMLNNEDMLGVTTSTLSEGFAKGDVVRCVVTPNDGVEDGAPVPSNEILVVNTPPQIGSVAIQPDFVAPCETFSCEVQDVAEPDEADNLTFAYRWELNGSPIPPVTKTLAATAYAPNDTLRCYAKPTDGAFKLLPNGGISTIWGDEIGSNLGTVINTPPSVDSVSLGPPDPLVGDIVTCEPAGFNDPDCNPPAKFVIIWYVDGEAVEDEDGPTFVLDGVHAGAKIQCQAIPDDDYTLGSGKLSNVLNVFNAPPTNVVVTIEAPEGAQGPLTCEFQVEPTDTDPLTYTWYWQTNDQPEVVGTQVLAAELVSDCDLVRCRVEVSDGLETTPSNVASVNLPNGDDCDDGDLCTTHSCLPEGGCLNNPNTVSCDDGDPCTVDDSCSETGCAGQPDDCDDGNLCTTDACNPMTGCQHSYNPTICDDDNPCTTDTCDLAVGSCANEHLPDGTTCDGDGDGCTVEDSCFAGTCIIGVAADCPGDPDVCQHQVCESLSPHAHLCKTVFTADTVSCEDGLQCTTNDHCNGSGTCVPGDHLDCSPGAGPCQVGSCVEGSGCVFVSVPDDSPCNSDDDGCTEGDSCSDGLCLPGALVDCDLEGDACKIGVCESLGPAVHSCEFVPTAEGTPCDTGDFCEVDTSCDGIGECANGMPRDCEAEAGYSCHTAYCDSDGAVCVPVKAADGTGCDDDNICTVIDACVNGYCSGSGDACFEEPLSVAVSGSSRPDVADLGYGRYVVQWAGDASELDGKVYDYVRLSDPYGSREDEERNVAGAVMTEASQTLTQFTTPTAVAANGSFMTVSWTGTGCSCEDIAGCDCSTGELVARTYDYLGEPLAENTSIESRTFYVDGPAANLYSGTLSITQNDTDTLALGDGSWAIFKIDTISASSSYTWSSDTSMGVQYTPLSNGLIPGTPVELVPRSEFSIQFTFDVVALPDTNEFLLVWVDTLSALGHAKWDQVWLQRFSSLGIALDDPQLIYENKLGDGHDMRRLEARYVPATGELLIVWTDGQGTSGLDRVRWFWSNLAGEMLGVDASCAYLITGCPTWTANDDGLGNQRLGGVGVFSDGGFVITWDDDSGDVDGYGAKARIFEVDGSPATSEIDLNREGVGDQAYPGVAVLANDDWVTAFADSFNQVWTRRYDRDGTHVVGRLERTANATTSGQQEGLVGAQGHDDDIFVAWSSPFAGNSGTEVVGRLIGDDGAPISAEEQVNTTMSGTQHAPAITPTPNGWMVVWQSDAQGALGTEVHGRLIDDSGAPTGAEFTVPTDTDSDQNSPSITASEDAVLVVWETQTLFANIAGRLLDFDGQPLGDQFLLTTTGHSLSPEVVTLPDGTGYLAIWEDHWGSDVDVILRHLDAQGAQVGEDIVAHSASELDQTSASIAVGPAGYAVVCVATSTNEGADVMGIGCQRITTSGLEHIGPELVPHEVGSAQANPAVGYLSDGSWTVAWDTLGVDGDDTAVQFQRYDAFGVVLGQRILANRSHQGSQGIPILIPLSGPTNSLFIGWQSGNDGDADAIYRVLPGQ